MYFIAQSNYRCVLDKLLKNIFQHISAVLKRSSNCEGKKQNKNNIQKIVHIVPMQAGTRQE